jgi:hypothetical protein
MWGALPVHTPLAHQSWVLKLTYTPSAAADGFLLLLLLLLLQGLCAPRAAASAAALQGHAW